MNESEVEIMGKMFARGYQASRAEKERQDKAAVDRIAACIILQDYLSYIS